ncbi:hypothetical protein HZA99_01825, partial [Candidatus Woesearchaeota archaeon]|nr:hypothetical protein [Candidatus Woesearchaeota archaeon]
MEKTEKINIYLLSIVAVVAVVGIVILIFSSAQQSISTEQSLVGEGFAPPKFSVPKECKLYCAYFSKCGYTTYETCGILMW